jgi:hypothetical protein
MSSVEIKIKGVKSVNRGKPRSKRGKRKSKTGLLEKTKMPEYSFRGLPYNYVSPQQPTYIDRPAPQLLQQQQPAIDYKPMAEMLSQQLALARIKAQSSQEQNMLPPQEASGVSVEEIGLPQGKVTTEGRGKRSGKSKRQIDLSSSRSTPVIDTSPEEELKVEPVPANPARKLGTKLKLVDKFAEKKGGKSATKAKDDK